MGRNFTLDDLPPALRAQAVRKIREQARPGTVTRHVQSDASEKDWQQTVIETFTSRGWLVYHTWNSRNSPKGFPDVIAVHPGVDGLDLLANAAMERREHVFLQMLEQTRTATGRAIAAELKRDSGRTTPEQRMWLLAFQAVGIPAFLWRPSDMPDVERIADSIAD